MRVFFHQLYFPLICVFAINLGIATTSCSGDDLANAPQRATASSLRVQLAQADNQGIDELQDLTLQKAISAEIEARFGTVDEPMFWSTFPADTKSSRTAQRQLVWNLIRGRELFELKCASCHGSLGAGDGPQASLHNPKPRDFRRGIFKWTSTQMAETAHLFDIQETIRLGVPGTAMPASTDLTERESRALAEYVRWLAWRGEFGIRLTDEAIDIGEPESVGDELLEVIVKRWDRANEHILVPETKPPPLTAELISQGRKLFLSPKAKCAVCHGPEGRGDGEYLKKIPRLPNGRPAEQPGLLDLWHHVAVMPDLSTDPYRGGDGLNDVYRRIAGGIKGTSMPAYGRNISDQEIWSLVAYCLSLKKGGTNQKPKTPRQEPLKIVAERSPLNAKEKITAHRSTGLGSVAGTILMSGDIPQTKVLVEKGTEIRGYRFEDDLIDESLLVDPQTRGVANVIVYLLIRPEQAPNISDSSREQVNEKPILLSDPSRFFPRILLPQVKQPIQIKNRSKLVGNVHTSPARNSSFNRVLRPNEMVELTYTRPELVPVKVQSDFHAWKLAFHLPLSHPFAATTSKQGRFRIDGLPAGHHRFRIWHERVGLISSDWEIDVSANKTSNVVQEIPMERFGEKSGR